MRHRCWVAVLDEWERLRRRPPERCSLRDRDRKNKSRCTRRRSMSRAAAPWRPLRSHRQDSVHHHGPLPLWCGRAMNSSRSSRQSLRPYLRQRRARGRTLRYPCACRIRRSRGRTKPQKPSLSIEPIALSTLPCVAPYSRVATDTKFLARVGGRTRHRAVYLCRYKALRFACAASPPYTARLFEAVSAPGTSRSM